MEFIAIYQSAHPKAEEEAGSILNTLREAGIGSVRVRVDDQPGSGVRSVVVEVEEGSIYDAQALLQQQEMTFEGLDAAAALDFQVAFYSDQHDAEHEGMAVKSLLEANGIAAFLADSGVLPNFPCKVLVPREDALRAAELIEAARATGPADAEAAAQASADAEG
ncbi:MAG: DUF2007 domain-containing protein [Bryobacterales bacterium]|jgi:hypothetical protein|nr:DUF2007 domain-containing protein [Bryobacterales bacterium]